MLCYLITMMASTCMSSYNDENMVQNMKPKRKNSEKRKEKSRFAARARRSHESEQFSEMAKCLPVEQNILQNMDKASVMRLAIGYIKMAHLTEELRNKGSVCDTSDCIEPQLVQTLNGFVLIMSLEGDIIYVSESIEDFIGLKQLDVIGNSIYEYTHPCDQKEVKDVLNSQSTRLIAGDLSVEEENGVEIVTRIKCAFTEKGKCVNVKSGNYKSMVITGRCLKFEKTSCFLLTAEPIQTLTGFTSSTGTYISRHAPDMKFTSIDDCIETISGFKTSELIGKSAYDYFHTIDVQSISKSLHDLVGEINMYKKANVCVCSNDDQMGYEVTEFHPSQFVILLSSWILYNKGQCRSGYYRFLSKCGGYFWLQTDATLITDNSGQPLEIVCVNYIISGIENKHEIISEVQQFAQCSREVQSLIQAEKCNADDLLQLFSTYENTSEASNQYPTNPLFPIIQNTSFTSANDHLLPLAVPKPATATIFAPRTDDMNSGFLVFPSEDGDETILTDADLFDPEQDLTHLAPLAGDECDISLDLTNLPHLDGLMDDILKAMGLSASENGSLNTIDTVKNVVSCGESDVETNDNFSMECFAANDNKLMPYIPPAVVEEEIQFSCDDECSENDLRTEHEVIDSLTVSGPPKENDTSNYYNRNPPLDDGGGQRVNSSDGCNSVSDKDGRSDHNLLTNDPFLSFTNGGLLENFQTRVHTKSPPYSHGVKTDMFGTNSSSVWDSPPPSSNNSTLTNDLDICSSLEDDLEPKSSHIPLSDDFPLLSDDSIWDSFINSNIGDIMNTDEFLPARTTAEGIGSLNSKQPVPTLPLNSNLAMLLQGPLPVLRKTIGNMGAKNGNKPPNVIVVEMSNCGNIRSNAGVHKVVQMNRTQAARSTTKSTSNYSNVVYANIGEKQYVQTRCTSKRPCPMSPIAGQRRATAMQSTNSNNNNGASNCAITNGKRLKVVSSQSVTNKSQAPPPVLSAGSVLMNLLVNGEDVNNGYTKCIVSTPV